MKPPYSDTQISLLWQGKKSFYSPHFQKHKNYHDLLLRLPAHTDNAQAS